MNSAVARTRRARNIVRPSQAGRSNRALLAAAIVAVFAAVLALLLVTRSGAAGPANGSEHSLGVASAAVVVDEWSDFE